MVQPHHSMSHRPPMHHAGLYLNSSSLCSPTSHALSQDYSTPYLEPRLLTFKVTFRTLLGSTFTPSPHPAPAAPAATCKSYVFPDLQHHLYPLTQQSTGRTGHDHRAYTWTQTLHTGTTQGIPASSQSVFPTHYFLSSFCLNRNFPKKESKK